MIKVGSETIGGIRKDKKFEPALGFTPYFEVPSVKEGAAMVKKAGGTLIGENVAIEGGYGHFQVFKDLDGNTLSLWSKKP